MANIGTIAVSLVITNEYSIQIENNDIIEVSIFEDIYNFCMYGYVTFIDKIGHTEILENLNGQYPLKIEWMEENSTKMSRIFNVYETDPVVSDSQLDPGMKVIKWTFADEILSHLRRKALCLNWGSTGTDGSTIIEQMASNIPDLSDRTKFKQFEETDTTFTNIDMNLKDIASNIKWIKKRCRSTSGNLGYLFYKNSQGVNFVTIQKLIESTEREKDDNGNSVRYVFSSQDDSTNKILEWQILPPGNIESFSNLAGSTYVSVGPNKQIIMNQRNYSQLISKAKMNISKITSAVPFSYDIKNNNPRMFIGMEGDKEKIDNATMYTFLLRLYAMNTIHLVVRGDSARYAGMLIDIDWKSSDPKMLTDKTMEGTWLVKAITHQFIPKGVTPPYRQLLVCMRPGYNQKDAKNSQITGVSSNKKTSVLN